MIIWCFKLFLMHCNSFYSSNRSSSRYCDYSGNKQTWPAKGYGAGQKKDEKDEE